MSGLISERLKNSWKSVERNEITPSEFQEEQDFLIAQYRKRWTRALLLDGYEDLEMSILAEIGLFLGTNDLDEVRQRCRYALSHVRREWEDRVDPESRESVERFYNESQAMMYELMWWHTLVDDTSPLAYVAAMEFAGQCGCRCCLDFGAGVGSGGIILARNGFDVTLADISSSMLDFCRWRFELRGLEGHFIDLKNSGLPDDAYDMVAAMDVFEHLVDTAGTVNVISGALKHGGFLFGRFHSDLDEDRPQHIVQDFEPTMKCLDSLDFVEVWRDDWLWGHQAFQKQ